MLAGYEEAVDSGQPVFMDADELADIADYYQINDQPDEAEAAISLALSLSPGAVAPLTYRVHEALYGGDTDAAWEWLDQIMEKEDPDYVYCRAEILLSEERVDEADEYLREELDKVPADEYQDYVVDVANIYADYNYPEKAMEWMALSKQEDTLEYKELMGRTLFGLGKYKDSQRIFNELIDRDPYSKYYWNALADAQYMDEDYKNAIESSEYAIAIDPKDPDSLMSKANGLFKLNNYEEALEYYKRYTELVPDDEFAYMNQGTCLINMGRNVEAIDVLERAIEVAGEREIYLPDIYQELAFAYSETGRTEDALGCLEKTDTMDCDHVQMEVVKGHILLADDRLAEAEFYFKEAIQQSEKPFKTMMRVIVSIYDNHYVEAAYNLFLHFFENAPDGQTDGYAYMALCCDDMKRYGEFLLYLKKACQLNPRECRLVLGHIFPEDLEPEEYYSYICGKLKA